MTHFTVVVFDSGKNVDRLLAKYDENIEMPWYCKGPVSDEDKQSFVDHYTKDDKEASVEEKARRATLSFEDLVKEFAVDWGGEGRWRFNEDGVLENWSRYNPDSKYDYYGVYSHELPEFVPFAFVTPDGVWHEKGHMGWWAMTWGEMTDEAWEKIWKDELAKYKGKFSILDCHI